ncbi:MAG: VCBS repeat-containing protein [Deltaproteobacteria bacterium]|nr:VCBS repeat-containing protein [Deltaproteobacteria bacterium]
MPLRPVLLVLLSCMTASCGGAPSDDTGAPRIDGDNDGWTADQDCDDSDASVHPGAYEACDGVDNDCDGFTDHDDPQYDGGTWYPDADGDGWGADEALCAGGEGTSKVPGDCDDTDPDVWPGAQEVCNGLDDDCDGLLDEEDDSLDTGTLSTWYRDADGDGFGDPRYSTVACVQPSGMAADGTDCDDTRAGVYPGSHQTEVPQDGVDQDCDGVDACLDIDCDGWTDIVFPCWGTDGDPTWDLEGDAFTMRPSPPGAYDGTALYPCVDDTCVADDAILLGESGASSAVLEDFDRDGYLDLAVGIYDGRGSSGGRSRVWWGGPDGYETGSRTFLTAYGVRRLEAADLDHDGWIDLVAAVARRDDDSWEASSAVWWGSPTGFGDATRLSTPGAQDVAVADLDGDGDEDLAFACARNDASFTAYSYVFWNEGGFSSLDATTLPTIGAFRVLADDLDADGDVDLFFVSFRGALTYRNDSYVYWNESGAFSETARTALYAHGGTDAAAADLDADGWTDLVVTHWRNDSGYLADSRIWWGSESGYDEGRTVAASSDGAAGVAIADLNNDGSLEIVIAQTRDDSGAATSSVVLWGRPASPRTYGAGSVAVEGATGVLARDLDHDGWIDLVFSAGGARIAPDAVPVVIWNESGTLADPVPLAATGSLAPPLAACR